MPLKRTFLTQYPSSCQLAPLRAADDQVLPDFPDIRLEVDQYHELRPREILTPAKEKFRSLFVVHSGALKNTQVDVWGKEHIRGFYFSGEIFGFEAIPYQQHQYLPSALQPTLVAEVRYKHFLEVMHNTDYPDLQHYILIHLSQLLNKRTYLTAVNAEQRVAYFLLDLAERINPAKKSVKFTFPMTRYDIGSYLNLSAETISRVFTAMRESGLIKVNYKEFEIINAKTLMSVSKGLVSCF